MTVVLNILISGCTLRHPTRMYAATTMSTKVTHLKRPVINRDFALSAKLPTTIPLNRAFDRKFITMQTPNQHLGYPLPQIR
jgi:hypothetical protein